ncbi:hypothetical protein Vadar_013554 [Vaccinium darrowii]|uniref:Uncharacterized protein n=1 Tax=Vaccinium darrowii TaxID=229202 RepID=A0ACB7YW92_9ERIC|nr:hypothetical protein Vadar_013554 [Vaccinium darrowii]
MAVLLATIHYKPFLVSILILLVHFHITEAQVGVCNGGVGDHLPSNQEVVDLYKSNGIGRMRMYAPNAEALQALRGSNIELVLDVPNDDLQRLANDPAAASQWVQDNVGNYYPDVKIRIIAVGNEVNPKAGFHCNILGTRKQPIPSSDGSFDGAAGSFMGPIIDFLKNTNNPLLVNIYPYFSRIGSPQDVSLPYALFTAPGVVVQDDQLQYRNLFDAMLDAAYAAVEKAGGPNVEIVVSESGWPSEGGDDASLENAETYYTNLIDHVKAGSGSPRRPGNAIETYLFAMFDENQKPGAESEKHFGIFSPDKQPKYQLNFN